MRRFWDLHKFGEELLGKISPETVELLGTPYGPKNI